VNEFLPAVGQGAIGIEARADDSRTREMLAAINHADTFSALAAERAFLAVLDGSCRTPIGGHATISGGRLRFRGMVVKPDGSEAFEASREGNVRDAEELGADAGAELKGSAGPDFFSV
jgi:hydroxymethylbilane synthase